MDEEIQATSLRSFRTASHANLGRKPLPHRLQRHLLLPKTHRQGGEELGRRPREDQEDLRQARNTRSREKVPSRSRRSIRIRGCLSQPPETLGGQGCNLL